MQKTNFKPRAFLFDLNGTMIDDMDYHNKAWHSILTEQLGASIAFHEVKKEMYGKNKELLARIFGKDHFSADEIEKISMEKEISYQAAYQPHLSLIAGLPAFLKKAADRHIAMAIGSAAIPFNINFVLDGLNIRPYFKAIVSADDVETSKPHPETFLKAAKYLGIDAVDCLVFEDAPKGVEAAFHAGMKCIVLTTMHSTDEFKHYSNVIACIENYNDPILNTLL